MNGENQLLTEQLIFIYKLTNEIDKTIERLMLKKPLNASSYPFSPNPKMLPTAFS